MNTSEGPRKRLIGDILNQGIPVPVNNATLLRKDEWLEMDQRVGEAARARLRAWSDLAASSTYSGFDGMTKLVLEHEQMADVGEAVQDMDGLTEGRHDQPLFGVDAIPLAITHVDFHFSMRWLSVSRQGGMPLDTRMAAMAGRRVAELIEQQTIGSATGMTFGAAQYAGFPSGGYGAAAMTSTPTTYGYLNFPARLTNDTMTQPDGTNGTTVLAEWLDCLESLYAANFHGPFMAYVDASYQQYLDDDYKTNSDKTLRQRLLEIDAIADIRKLDYMTTTATGKGATVVFVQMTSDVARAVIGMPITTVQWDSRGGMQLNFKVMAIMTPQLYTDYNGNCGIMVARTAV